MVPGSHDDMATESPDVTFTRVKGSQNGHRRQQQAYEVAARITHEDLWQEASCGT